MGTRVSVVIPADHTRHGDNPLHAIRIVKPQSRRRHPRKCAQNLFMLKSKLNLEPIVERVSETLATKTLHIYTCVSLRISSRGLCLRLGRFTISACHLRFLVFLYTFHLDKQVLVRQRLRQIRQELEMRHGMHWRRRSDLWRLFRALRL